MAFPKYDSYKDSGEDWLGEVPEHWEVKSLSSILINRNEKNEPVKTKDILSLSIASGVTPYSDENRGGNKAKNDLTAYKLAYPGDIVLNSMNVVVGAVGLSKYFGAISPVYYALYLRNKEKTSIDFYSYIFSNSTFQKYLFQYGKGILVKKSDSGKLNTIRMKISMQDLKKVPLPLPPITEQKRIVEFLDHKTSEIDQAIAKKQRLIKLLQEQKTILINQAVTKGLNLKAPMRDSGVEWIGEVPEHWEVSRIGFIGEVGNGSTPNRSNAAYWESGSIPWLNSSKVNDGVIYYAEQFVTKRAVDECHLPIVKPNNIVIAITGEGKTRGTAALCKIETTINQHLAYIRISVPRIIPDFLLLYLKGMYEWMRFESSSAGSTKGAITCDDVKKYKISIPPVLEQKKIIDYTKETIKEIDTLIEKSLQSIDCLNSLKQILVSKAVTGKIKI